MQAIKTRTNLCTLLRSDKWSCPRLDSAPYIYTYKNITNISPRVYFADRQIIYLSNINTAPPLPPPSINQLILIWNGIAEIPRTTPNIFALIPYVWSRRFISLTCRFHLYNVHIPNFRLMSVPSVYSVDNYVTLDAINEILTSPANVLFVWNYLCDKFLKVVIWIILLREVCNAFSLVGV